ncbi:MAG: lactonase family protein [Fuerstiella sp.]|nr:lactonase family protein [Fuerstiella sp.]
MLIDALVANDAVLEMTRFYIGTYNSPTSHGIYRSELDPATGQLAEPVLAVEAVNSSFLAIHPSKKFLYAVSESGDGSVGAYAIDQGSGDLKLLNQQPSGGAGACHLVVDESGAHVLVANYYVGNASVLRLSADGRLGPQTGFVQHRSVIGSNGRKKNPLAHAIHLDAVNRFAFVCDAGVDKVFIYRYDAVEGTLTPNDPPAGIVAADAAPRHFAWHPDGQHAYVINESELSLTLFDYTPETGELTAVQTISTVPDGVNRKGYSTAEVVVHPSGKFVYGSNRGHDTIAGFRIDPVSRRLTAIGQFAGGTIKVPRNFNIDPSGNFALVEGRESDNIVVFRIDAQTGEFQATGHSISIGQPACVKFFVR